MHSSAVSLEIHCLADFPSVDFQSLFEFSDLKPILFRRIEAIDPGDVPFSSCVLRRFAQGNFLEFGISGD